jgi:sugar phosphate isomerase/epimerase
VDEIDDRIAVSSWSVHRQLGVTHPHNLASNTVGPREETYGPGEVELIDLPALVASHHIRALELCSFHLPSRDKAYLDELRSAFVTARVRLQTLLIEAGDLSDPNTASRDAAWISGWVDVANDLGAENARIIAGKQKPTKEALDLSAKGLKAIAARNAGPAKLVTENWFDLLSTPEAVNYLLDQCDGQIGLNGDFGNWTGEGKYDALSKIFGRASICHAKATFVHGAMNQRDYGRCVDVAEAAGYTGPYTLIFDSNEPDEWEGIAMERAFIHDRLLAA